MSLVVFGLNFTLDFRGGSQFDIKSPTASTKTITDSVSAIVKDPQVVTSSDSTGRHVIVKTTPLSQNQLSEVRQAIATDAGQKDNPNAVTVTRCPAPGAMRSPRRRSPV